MGDYQCGVCLYDGKNVPLSIRHDLLVCDACGTSYEQHDKSALPRFQEEWISISDINYVLLRPPIEKIDVRVVPTITLRYLMADCYHSMLIGRYNAGIVMLGVFIEELCKEIILTHTGEKPKGELGLAIDKLTKLKILKTHELDFLRSFKNNIRNCYQHSDVNQLTSGCTASIKQITFDPQSDSQSILEKINNSIQSKENYKNVSATDNLSIAAFVKICLDGRTAIELFNQVYDFTIECGIRYIFNKCYKK